MAQGICPHVINKSGRFLCVFRGVKKEKIADLPCGEETIADCSRKLSEIAWNRKPRAWSSVPTEEQLESGRVRSGERI